MGVNWNRRVSFRMLAMACALLLSVSGISGCAQAKESNAGSSVEAPDASDTEVNVQDEIAVDEGYVLAEQTGVMEKDWKEFTIQLNHKVITLPCEAKDLESAGLTMNTDFIPADKLVNRGNRESVYYQNGSGDAILVTFLNPDKAQKQLKECMVTGIAVTEYDLTAGNLTVTFPGGVQMYSSKSAAIIAYGSDYEVYESDMLHMYTWHDEKSYYKSCEIDYDAETLKATCMIINC